MVGSARIEKYEVISFDIFDTLINRKVYAPKNIFKYVERAYNRRHPGNGIDGFVEKRLLAAKEATAAADGREITIRQIYDRIDFDGRDELMALEKQTEIAMCEPNPSVMAIYNRCIQLKKRIIIITDMYLDRETIVSMLEKCGVHQFEKLYLSSEIGVTKKEGELFRFVIDDLKIEPTRIKHFGDRLRTDYLNSKKHGMSSCRCERFTNHLSFTKDKEYDERQSDLLAFTNIQIQRYSDESDFFQWGYEAFGPILLGYTQWVRESVQREKMDKVFFLARDMFLIEKLYNELYPGQDTVYLEVSRRSLREAFVLKANRLESIFDTITRKNYTVSEMLSHIGIDTEACGWLKEKYGQYLNARVDDGNKGKPWYVELERDVLNELSNRENYTLPYLSQMRFFDDGRIAIVDIGWHGTIQNMLEKISDRKVKGLYFGIGKRHYYDEMDLDGYWYRVDNEVDAIPNMTLVAFIETMLFNDVGTTIRYAMNDGLVEPVHRQSERSESKPISDFQRGALRFVHDYIELFTADVLIERDEAVRAFHRLVYQPTLHQAELFSVLPYEEGSVDYFAKKSRTVEYLVHPKKLLKDYEASKWKTGFIKRLFPFMRRPDRIDSLIKSRRAR